MKPASRIRLAGQSSRSHARAQVCGPGLDPDGGAPQDEGKPGFLGKPRAAVYERLSVPIVGKPLPHTLLIHIVGSSIPRGGAAPRKTEDGSLGAIVDSADGCFDNGGADSVGQSGQPVNVDLCSFDALQQKCR